MLDNIFNVSYRTSADRILFPTTICATEGLTQTVRWTKLCCSGRRCSCLQILQFEKCKKVFNNNSFFALRDTSHFFVYNVSVGASDNQLCCDGFSKNFPLERYSFLNPYFQISNYFGNSREEVKLNVQNIS